VARPGGCDILGLLGGDLSEITSICRIQSYVLLIKMIIFVFLQIKRGDVEHHLQTDMGLHLDLSYVKLNNTEDQLRNTRDELHDTQEKLKKFEKITRKLEEKVTALENRVRQCSEEHTWKISGITEVLNQLREGKMPEIKSAPFYTRKYGYKFKITLSPETLNRFLPFLCYQLRVNFVLMKGEYDAILPWPFNEKVTFTLIDQQKNQNDRENIVNFLPANPDNDLWKRKPVSDENEPSSLDNFVSLIKLRERRFIVDDTIFIQVKIDPP